MIIVGLDPGKETGFAACKLGVDGYFIVDTYRIHRAMQKILEFKESGMDLYVRFEDARKWRSHGKHVYGKDQGAGSIKRDCSIWEDFLADHGIPFESVNLTASLKKIDVGVFQQLTGWKKRTSNHARDAALLIYKFKPRNYGK